MDNVTLSELTILLVEPSRMQRNLIQRRFHEAGIDNFLFADNCEEAYLLATTSAPDLVVSAMYFSDGNATDLITRLRANRLCETQAFMLISSEASHHNLDAIKQAGVIAILPKPFEFTHLLNALHSTLSYIDPDESLDPVKLAQLSVLVVDDSRTAQRHVGKVLENIGITHIEYADHGQQALEKLQEGDFGLVVTDYNMPIMDGAALVEILRQHEKLSGIPILMVTSEVDGAKLNGVRQSGVSALVDKPFHIDTVKQLIQQIL
jgi:two-component system chemotaxis response regulator CheY